jgi:type IV fimbrial biogenesis protein FimT
MVAVTLAAILIAMGMPSFTTGMQNRQIRAAADAVQNGLQVARTEALRRNRPVKFELRANNSWTVGCETEDASVVDGQQLCPAVLQTREGSEGSSQATTTAQELDAASGSVAGSPIFGGNLTFTPLGRITPGTLPAGSIAEYLFTNPAAGSCAADGGEMRCLSVRVTASGQIRMCDPAVTAADDARKC